MALDPLASPEDLATRLGVEPYAAAERDQVEALLGDASDELRSILGQPINRMTSTVTLYASRHGRVDLPAFPVVSIGSVELDGVEVDPGCYRVQDKTLHLPMVCRGDEVVVTFTHGWDEIPGELVKWTCVLGAAMKSGVDATGSLGMIAGVGQSSEAIDDYQHTTQGPEASGGDPTSGLTLPQVIVDRLRAAYGGLGLINWIEVEG